MSGGLLIIFHSYVNLPEGTFKKGPFVFNISAPNRWLSDAMLLSVLVPWGTKTPMSQCTISEEAQRDIAKAEDDGLLANHGVVTG